MALYSYGPKVHEFGGHAKRVVSLDADWSDAQVASGGRDRMVRTRSRGV